MIRVTSINNLLVKASHRVMPIFKVEGQYNAPYAQKKSGAQILARCRNVFYNTGSLDPNTYLGVLESLSLITWFIIWDLAQNRDFALKPVSIFISFPIFFPLFSWKHLYLVREG